MKTYFTLLLLSISLYSFAQTKIISYKSHSGSITSLQNEKDSNFGRIGMIPKFAAHKIVKISDTSMVMYYSADWQDTIYHHYFYPIPTVQWEQFTKIYPEVKEFVGFEKESGVIEHKVPDSPNPPIKKGGFPLLMFLIFCTFIYTVQNKKTRT